MVIQKRIRTTVNNNWGAWVTLTASEWPYTNTDLVEYKELNDKVLINIEDVTSNVQIQTDDTGKFYVSGDGYFDNLMETATLHLKAQYENGRITGPAFAQVYATLYQSLSAQAMQFAQGKAQQEAVADKAVAEAGLAQIALEVAEQTSTDKVLTSNYKRAVEEVNKNVAVGTETSKIGLIAAQLSKMTADTSYVTTQEAMLEQQVEDNRLIKAVGEMGDTFGMLGAGGLVVSGDMWSSYFTTLNTLASVAVPSSTTVTKVT